MDLHGEVEAERLPRCFVDTLFCSRRVIPSVLVLSTLPLIVILGNVKAQLNGQDVPVKCSERWTEEARCRHPLAKWQAGSGVFKLGDVKPENRDRSAVLDNNATNVWLVTFGVQNMSRHAAGAMQIIKCPSFIYRILGARMA